MSCCLYLLSITDSVGFALLCFVISFLQLSAIDVSARTTMKGAANCDKHCELQNSVNQQILERKLHFRDIPESMPASVSNHLIPATRTARLSCSCGLLLFWLSLCVRVLLSRLSGCLLGPLTHLKHGKSFRLHTASHAFCAFLVCVAYWDGCPLQLLGVCSNSPLKT